MRVDILENFFAEQLHVMTNDPKELPADFVGSGCLMTWPSRTPAWTESHLRHIAAHDWAWSAQVIAQRGKLFLHPQVRCQHAVDEAKLLPG